MRIKTFELMRNFLKSFFIGYFAIGSLLSIPLSLSYLYAQWFVLIKMGWSIFSLTGLGFILMSGYLIVISPMIKVAFWLPSLIMWFVDPNGYSFLMWLAPGFFAEEIQVG